MVFENWYIPSLFYGTMVLTADYKTKLRSVKKTITQERQEDIQVKNKLLDRTVNIRELVNSHIQVKNELLDKTVNIRELVNSHKKQWNEQRDWFLEQQSS